MVEKLNDLNLHVANIGQTPTFIGRNTETVVDVTLVNSQALPLVREWQVDTKQDSGSDHRLISFNLHASPHGDLIKIGNTK